MTLCVCVVVVGELIAVLAMFEGGISQGCSPLVHLAMRMNAMLCY